MRERNSAFDESSDRRERERWLALVARIVASDDPESELTRPTEDGIPVPPLCMPASPRGGADFPGCSPHRRGSSPAQGVDGWDIRPQLAEPDPAAANAAIHEELEQGATSLTLRLDTALARGSAVPEALVAYDLPALDRALADVPVDRLTLALEGGERFAEGAALLLALASGRGLAAADLDARLGVDPLGCLAGGAPLDPDAAVASAVDLSLQARERWPSIVPLVADGSLYHEGGATAAQELACVMATAICYLRRLEAAGMRIEDAFGAIACTVTVDADLFVGIAKLRAARELWARIAEACGAADAGGAMLQAVTSRRAIADREPWTNLLRSTIAATAAALGNADSLTILPIDSSGSLEPRTVRRLSRTVQLVLQEESRLGAVIDPAGGSGHVEMLTDGLCAKAWEWLGTIEAAGGMLEALRKGSIQTMVADAWRKRRQEAATRDKVLVGTNRFSLLNETKAPHDHRRAARDEARDVCGRLGARERTPRPFADLLAAAADGAMLVGPPIRSSGIEPIRRHTLDEDWSRLRRRGDAALAQKGDRPSAFLAGLGPTARHADRLAWTRDLLAAGGIESASSPPIQGHDDVDPALRSCASTICVIVAGAALDAQLAQAVAAAARGRGAIRVDLSAGSAVEEALLAGIGATGIVADGRDLVAWLDTVHDVLGSPRPAEGDER
jgi:methylmalonyl-CoA mutase